MFSCQITARVHSIATPELTKNTFSVLYGVLSLSSFQNNLCVPLEFERDRFYSHVFIFVKKEFICSTPSHQLKQEKERFLVNIYSCFNILFRKNLFVQQSAPSAQLQYDKECFGRFFLLVLVQLNLSSLRGIYLFNTFTSATVRERTFFGEYLFLFQYSFQNEFICSAFGTFSPATV
jgi:hypothetical protein